MGNKNKYISVTEPWVGVVFEDGRKGSNFWWEVIEVISAPNNIVMARYHPDHKNCGGEPWPP